MLMQHPGPSGDSIEAGWNAAPKGPGSR